MSPCQSNSRSSTSRVADRLPLWGPIHLAWTVKEKKKTSCSRSTVAESRVQIDALYRSPIIIQQDEDCLATPNPLLIPAPHNANPCEYVPAHIPTVQCLSKSSVIAGKCSHNNARVVGNGEGQLRSRLHNEKQGVAFCFAHESSRFVESPTLPLSLRIYVPSDSALKVLNLSENRLFRCRRRREITVPIELFLFSDIQSYT